MIKSLKYGILLLAIMSVSTANAQDDKISATANAVKVKELNLKKQQLAQRIAIEDRKRNRHEHGMSPEKQEILNLKQDSICLELRSELVNIECEIKEYLKK